jgi:hypothetical protein
MAETHRCAHAGDADKIDVHRRERAGSEPGALRVSASAVFPAERLIGPSSVATLDLGIGDGRHRKTFCVSVRDVGTSS